MTCHVLRLTAESECGVCTRAIPAGHRLITDQIEDPIFVAVCEGCTDGLDGARAAVRLLESKGGAARKRTGAAT